MTTYARDIRWGKYKGYEGPWYPGTLKYKVPENPLPAEKIAAVITATEGGCFDAVNRYDRCIDTQGLIQWCNRANMFFVDQIYSTLKEEHLKPVQAVAATHGYIYRWKGSEPGDAGFQSKFFSPRVGWVDTPEKQAAMYFGGGTGRLGSWTDEQKVYAKEWVAAAVDVWSNPSAVQAQMKFTLARLSGFFIYGDRAKQVLGAALKEETDVSQAFYAAYLSFAANNPKAASDALSAALDQLAGKAAMFSPSWLVEVLNSLTFYPGISIYPHRYNKIRPVIEELFGLDLPDFANDLAQFKKSFPERFMDPKEVQLALLALGYDLGPWGPDGNFGAKSRDALREFELEHGVPPHAVDGLLDSHTLRRLEQELECRGIKALDGDPDS